MPLPTAHMVTLAREHATVASSVLRRAYVPTGRRTQCGGKGRWGAGKVQQQTLVPRSAVG